MNEITLDELCKKIESLENKIRMNELQRRLDVSNITKDFNDMKRKIVTLSKNLENLRKEYEVDGTLTKAEIDELLAALDSEPIIKKS